MRRTLPLALGLALLLAGPAWAQAKLAPWDQPQAKAESRRILKAIVDVVNASERNDGRVALYSLRDKAWPVRLISAVRLSAMGLQRGPARALKKSAQPEEQPLAAAHTALAAAKEFVNKTPRAKLSEGPFSRITVTEALRTWSAFVVERFLSGREQTATRAAMLVSILAGRHVIPRTSRGWLARWLLTRVDQQAALKDLKAKSARAAAKQDGAEVFAWYHANLAYFYWHPKARRFLLDAEARKAKTPSATFRKQTPWKKDEGPNAPVTSPRTQQ